VSDFARAADYGYSIDEILQMEMRILFKAKWQVNPPTINIWTNWYMCQWDLFAEKHSKAILCCFKKASERSY
jgi:cyclin E